MIRNKNLYVQSVLEGVITVNTAITTPIDENLLRWVRSKIDKTLNDFLPIWDRVWSKTITQLVSNLTNLKSNFDNNTPKTTKVSREQVKGIIIPFIKNLRKPIETAFRSPASLLELERLQVSLVEDLTDEAIKVLHDPNEIFSPSKLQKILDSKVKSKENFAKIRQLELDYNTQNTVEEPKSKKKPKRKIIGLRKK